MNDAYCSFPSAKLPYKPRFLTYFTLISKQSTQAAIGHTSVKLFSIYFCVTYVAHVPVLKSPEWSTSTEVAIKQVAAGERRRAKRRKVVQHEETLTVEGSL